jgi:type IV pilus assembly protein PilM
MIEQRTGIPVEIVNPFRRIEVPDKILKPVYLEQIAPMAAVAVGLGLRRSGDHQ